MIQLTRDLAWAFVRELVADPLRAHERHADRDFIQHNPGIADGVAGFAAFCAAEKDATAARVIDLVVVDADRFAVHSHVFSGPADRGRVIVDLWRVERGKLAEHWDVVQPVPLGVVHPNTMWCGKGSDYASARALGPFVSPAGGWPDDKVRGADTRAAIDSYRAELAEGDIEQSVRRWFATSYVQHSPHIGDGAEGAIDYFVRQRQDTLGRRPQTRMITLIAEGDLVLYHRHVVRPNGPPLGDVQIDTFRVTDGKISEHWDVKQPVIAATVSGRAMW